MITPFILVLIAITAGFLTILMIFNMRLGLFIFLVTLPFQNIYFPTPLMFISLSDIFASLIFLSWIMLVISGRMQLGKTKVLIFPAIFWVLSLIGCLTSIDQITSFRFTLRLLSYFAIFIVLLNILTDMRTIRLVIYALAVQLLIVSAVTNWKYLSSDVKIEDIADVDEEYEHGGIRQGGIEQNMNITAYNITMLMPLIFGLGLMEKRKYILMVLPVSFSALLITMSRGGWVAFASSLIFLPRLKSKHIVLLIILFTIIFSLFYTLFIGRIEATNLETESISIRILMYKFGWRIFTDHPFLGIGIGNFTINAYREYPLMRQELTTEIDYCSPHNQYLGILAENGIFAFLIYLWFLFVTGYIGVKSRNTGGANTINIRKCAFSSFIVILVSQMFTYFGLRNYLFWSVIALIYCLYDISMRESKTNETVAKLSSFENNNVEIFEKRLDE